MVIRNKNKKTFIRLVIIASAVLVGVAVLFITLSMRNNSRSVPVKSNTVSNNKTATRAQKVIDDRYGLPARLVIPKINVDTDIKQMGLTASGNMEAPRTDADAGWYKNGPHPGNVGSAVVAGHLGVKYRAVFSELSKLVKGDTISVTDDRAQTVSFVVSGTYAYDNNETPSEVFTSTTGAHLNLITCNGSYEPSKGTYSKRLVVFTDLIE